ncbi:hypothetical protein JTB14_033917 [Gonioctena quinquepunctata]|nr:hypothetical protein JTB14_033917 [Gonioctena quinquepunctata]
MADILPSGSEDENLSDSDDDYVPNPNTKDAVSSDEGDISVYDSEDEEPLSNVSARGKQKYTWTKFEELHQIDEPTDQNTAFDRSNDSHNILSPECQYIPDYEYGEGEAGDINKTIDEFIENPENYHLECHTTTIHSAQEAPLLTFPYSDNHKLP